MRAGSFATQVAPIAAVAQVAPIARIAGVVSLARVAVVVAVGLGAGCFSPSYGDGHLQCELGDHPCPAGLICFESHCWRPAAIPKQVPLVWTSCGGGAGVADSGSQIGISVGELPVGGVVRSDSGTTLSFGYFAGSTE
jgi:hypothetical protein